MNVLLGIGHLKKQKLRDDNVGNIVVHRRPQENNAVNEQAGINVPRPLSAASLLDYNWNEKILHVIEATSFVNYRKDYLEDVETRTRRRFALARQEG
jgi:hypothetical protein